MMKMTKTDIIQALDLQPHPIEGGYFALTYVSEHTTGHNGQRKLLSTIYYMLTDDSPIGYMHRNKSDIVHFYHSGSAMKYWIIDVNGQLTETVLGSDVTKGQCLQLLVKGGDWKLSHLMKDVGKVNYGLLGEAVSPGFEYADNEIATIELVSQLFPTLATQLAPFVKV
ncbi:cupin domain-containing protein [Shewanella sp. VB17]|uniref:cupin domain-containing protein n=1 Tax=Shewanella sp. VB17 TaxID=2739432 RepID=UPI001C257F43|nr:cupin domain-containing protein [Shewanella sp. VB17]